MSETLFNADFRQLVEQHPEAVMLTTHEPKIRYVNRAFTNITGFEPDDVIGRKPSVLSSGFHGKAFYTRLWKSLEENGRWEGLIWNRRQSGELYPQWLSINRLELSGSTHYVGIFQDIGRPEALQSQEAELAHYDALTRLPNRYLFRAFLEARIERTITQQQPFGLLFIDIDRFKQLNDLHGHFIGDHLIKAVASRLQSLLGDTNTIARLSGDEFCAIIEISENNTLEHHCRNLMDGFRESLVLQNLEFFVTLSIGAALYPDQGRNTEELMKHADLAMYSAKESGRACYRLFEPRLASRLEYREHLAGNLYRALHQDRSQFHVEYQPIMHLETGIVSGLEVLLRWTSESGSVSPLKFIPLAEERNLMGLVNTLVASLVQCDLTDHGVDLPAGIHLGLNLSAQSLTMGRLDELLLPLCLLAEHLDWTLVVELTESQLLSLDIKSLDELNRLKAMGIQIAIDDFGTGYSSLAYLQELPVDIIKLDQRFVAHLDRGGRQARISEAVVKLSLSLGLQVIAEGIETVAQQTRLESLGCSLGQGFLLGRPAVWTEVCQRLRAGLS